MKLNEKYSYQSLKRKAFLDVDPAEFNDSEIIGSGFYQDQPYSDVFPKDVKGLVLTKCNLDNVNIPEGATVNGGCNNHILTQNDGEYWIVDENLKPIRPRDAEKFVECGLSTDPKALPAEPLAEPITFTNDPARIEQQKIEALATDPVRLKAILVEKGELPATAAVAIGD